MPAVLRAAFIAALILVTAGNAAAQTTDAARVRDAATRALARIATAQTAWAASKQVCGSCHHQYQPALAFRAAREHGLPVNEPVARADAIKALTFADLDKAIQYTHVIEPAVDDAYRMVAAHAARIRPNLAAAVYARLLISRQNADGTWDSFHQRPPSSYSRFMMTALGLRAVQVYHHRRQAKEAEASIVRARRWLDSHAAPDTEGRSYQLLGLIWSGADRGRVRRLAGELAATQQADGGWNSIGGRESEAYSTGQALVAMREAGVPIADRAWQRGIAFLLDTQADDGSWKVTSRMVGPAPVSPPYFDAGFPYGHDQFISMSGTSWAVMALAAALGPSQPAAIVPLEHTEPANVEPWAETMIFGSVGDVKRLLDGGLDPNAATASGGTTALMMAAPDAAKMRLLLDRGAKVNARARTRFSALMVAAQYQHSEDAVNLLLDRGAEVVPAPGVEAPVFNANPFFLASYAGNAKVLKRLRDAGSKIDDPMLVIGTSRTTPLLGAFKFGDVAVAQTLFDLGAPIDFADGNGITMLGRTVLNNEVEMARMLISRGADVNHVDRLGMTPLLWAASIDFGDAAVIDLLLASGARADAKDANGLTALDLARKYRHTHLIPSLERARATN